MRTISQLFLGLLAVHAKLAGAILPQQPRIEFTDNQGAYPNTDGYSDSFQVRAELSGEGLVSISNALLTLARLGTAGEVRLLLQQDFDLSVLNSAFHIAKKGKTSGHQECVKLINDERKIKLKTRLDELVIAKSHDFEHDYKLKKEGRSKDDYIAIAKLEDFEQVINEIKNLSLSPQEQENMAILVLNNMPILSLLTIYDDDKWIEVFLRLKMNLGPYQAGPGWKTPVMIAAQNGNYAIFNRLVQAGAYVFSINDRNESVLSLAAAGNTEGHKKCVEKYKYLKQSLLNKLRNDLNEIFRRRYKHLKSGDTLTHVPANAGLSMEFKNFLDHVKHLSLSQEDKAFILDLPNEPTGSPMLLVMIYFDDTAWVIDLIRAGASIDIKSNQNMRPLSQAAINKNPKIMEELLIAGADPNEGIPLHEAVESNCKECVAVLFRSHELGRKIQLELNVQLEKNWETPAIAAARLGRHEILQMLVYKGASLLFRNSKGENAYTLAKGGNTEDHKKCFAIIYKALKLDALNVNPRDDWAWVDWLIGSPAGITTFFIGIVIFAFVINRITGRDLCPVVQPPLDVEEKRDNSFEQKKSRLEFGLCLIISKANIPDRLRQYKDHIEKLKRLHEEEKQQFDINFEFNLGNLKKVTPIILAAKSRRNEILNELIQAGADIDAKDGEDVSVVGWTIINNNPNALQLLISAGAKINLADHQFALENNSTECAKLLFQKFKPGLLSEVNAARAALVKLVEQTQKKREESKAIQETINLKISEITEEDKASLSHVKFNLNNEVSGIIQEFSRLFLDIDNSIQLMAEEKEKSLETFSACDLRKKEINGHIETFTEKLRGYNSLLVRANAFVKKLPTLPEAVRKLKDLPEFKTHLLKAKDELLKIQEKLGGNLGAFSQNVDNYKAFLTPDILKKHQAKLEKLEKEFSPYTVRVKNLLSDIESLVNQLNNISIEQINNYHFAIQDKISEVRILCESLSAMLDKGLQAIKEFFDDRINAKPNSMPVVPREDKQKGVVEDGEKKEKSPPLIRRRNRPQALPSARQQQMPAAAAAAVAPQRVHPSPHAQRGRFFEASSGAHSPEKLDTMMNSFIRLSLGIEAFELEEKLLSPNLNNPDKKKTFALYSVLAFFALQLEFLNLTLALYDFSIGASKHKLENQRFLLVHRNWCEIDPKKVHEIFSNLTANIKNYLKSIPSWFAKIKNRGGGNKSAFNQDQRAQFFEALGIKISEQVNFAAGRAPILDNLIDSTVLTLNRSIAEQVAQAELDLQGRLKAIEYVYLPLIIYIHNLATKTEKQAERVEKFFLLHVDALRMLILICGELLYRCDGRENIRDPFLNRCMGVRNALAHDSELLSVKQVLYICAPLPKEDNDSKKLAEKIIENWFVLNMQKVDQQEFKPEQALALKGPAPAEAVAGGAAAAAPVPQTAASEPDSEEWFWGRPPRARR